MQRSGQPQADHASTHAHGPEGLHLRTSPGDNTDDAAESAAAESDEPGANATAATSVPNTPHTEAAQRYPQLAELNQWSWAWIGPDGDQTLVGYLAHPGGAADLLYVNSAEDAAVTRTDPEGAIRIHRTGDLDTVLAVLKQAD